MTASSPGALLLCRAEPAAVRPVAHLLRERLLLAPAGRDWSVLVPEGGPWQDGGEPVDRVVSGWAAALAVGAHWPVLALWWDVHHAGCTLATGFRRPVGYTWLADGTPVGEQEAMHTLADRLGLDPVLDVQALSTLTRTDPDADAAARLLGLTALLTGQGLALPPGLAPGEPAGRLRTTAHTHGADRVDRADRPGGADAVAPPGRPGADRGARNGPARGLATAQLVTGVPLLVWALTRRSAGWAAAGTLLIAHGALGLAVERPGGRNPAP
ncbi:hypothetical protein [Streptomyces sp. SP18CS02]|uniref:hypothetical protein n=1 Tax=Streptomyces sp. SP18CS02 TaxID=3002531 RepID=UPI002E7935F8|nr:hypothetical protein [Streptomyces sp. SP18CS02]MEE1757259.1 hypothetical protein [Streptomyces sp. SP18CS02]